MKRLYKFKYKIYKKFQSDLWGDIILKQKKNNNLYKFILDNFNFMLKKYYRQILTQYFQIKKNNYHEKKKTNLKLKKQNLLIEDLSKKLISFSTFFEKEKITDLKKINLILLKYVYGLFWLNYYNFYENLNIFIKPNHNYNEINDLINKKYNKYFNFKKFNFINFKRDKLKLKLKMTILWYLVQLKRRIFFKKKKIFGRFYINFKKKFIFNKYDLNSHLEADYMLPPVIFYYKKRRSSWWNLKIEQDKANVFFGFFNRKKFIRFQHFCFFSNKIRYYWILNLVGRLSFILFNFNIFNNMYYIYNFIKKGNLLVNNKIINNPNYSVKLFDNIAIKRELFKKIYLIFKWKLKKKNILLNYSSKYLEINYKILTASFWRYPDNSDIIGPYEFPFKNMSLDWLIYKNYH